MWRRYRNILGKTVPVLASETAATERCIAGRFCVSSGTLESCLTKPLHRRYMYCSENTPDDTRQKLLRCYRLSPPQDPGFPVAHFVAVPEDVMLFEPDIKALLGTREDWPQTCMYCLQEKSCGASFVCQAWRKDLLPVDPQPVRTHRL